MIAESNKDLKFKAMSIEFNFFEHSNWKLKDGKSFEWLVGLVLMILVIQRIRGNPNYSGKCSHYTVSKSGISTDYII